MSINQDINSKIFIVVPAYNEATSIKKVTDQLFEHYSNIVVIDDGSTDSTSELLEDSNVYHLRHMVNRGQGAAIQTGIEFALQVGADIIVTFDADGQHDVEDIHAIVEPILTGDCDLTLGSRFLGRTYNIPRSRKLILKAGILFTRVVSGIRVTDVHNGLRAFSRQSAKSLFISMDRMGHASEILDQIKKKGLKYREVPVTIHYSPYSLGKGQSSWNALKIALQFLIEKAVK